MRKTTIAKNVLSRIPKITEELQRSVEGQNHNMSNMGSINYSLVGAPAGVSEHRGSQRNARASSKSIKEIAKLQ